MLDQIMIGISNLLAPQNLPYTLLQLLIGFIIGFILKRVIKMALLVIVAAFLLVLLVSVSGIESPYLPNWKEMLYTLGNWGRAFVASIISLIPMGLGLIIGIIIGLLVT
ncbi:MAG TPA: hypothetical protein ENF41_03800 [Candidatus Bathyarchaeota archaeon]|nr:hypothetical protein [Candidatus Bathyarchaeota archaeon]